MRFLIPVLFLLAACSPAPEAKGPAATAPAAEATPAATPGRSVEFMAPSGNIACVYTPAGGTDVYETPDGHAEVQCDRNEPTYVRVVMSEQGPAHVVPTDERGCCSGQTIPYGDSWSEGPFSCDVTEAGVDCRNSAGNGFSLSRTRADVH